MSHRNGQPKPGASDRTEYRWRIRKGIGSPQDKERQKGLDTTKLLWQQRNRF